MREPRNALPARRPATGTAPAGSGDTDAALRPAADSFQADNRHGKPNARGFWRFTAPRSIASVAQIIIQRLDIVLVGIMKGPVDAAIYTAATRFLVAGQLGNAAISMAAQPQLTRLFAINDRAGANTVYQVTTAWLVLLTWPIYLLAAVFGPSVLAIFGRSYHAGSTVMLILALTMLFATACGQVDVVLITTGRSTWSLVNGLLAMCVNICVDLILIPRMGITGAAVGWAGPGGRVRADRAELRRGADRPAHARRAEAGHLDRGDRTRGRGHGAWVVVAARHLAPVRHARARPGSGRDQARPSAVVSFGRRFRITELCAILSAG
jgi:hypothetical protein